MSWCDGHEKGPSLVAGISGMIHSWKGGAKRLPPFFSASGKVLVVVLVNCP